MSLEGIRIVGFDLDGTLYKSTPEIDGRVRDKIAERILDVTPSLGSVSSARAFFEERYSQLGSGTEVLRTAGFNNKASEVMDECLATADVVDLIEPNPNLVLELESLRQEKTLYLLTSSPRDVALAKLERIGILPGTFDASIYSDHPAPGLSKQDGSAFTYAVDWFRRPAVTHAYIGDRLKSDILPAQRLGMTTIAAWNNILEADHRVESIEEIGGLFYE